MSDFKHILVPLDGSRLSERALPLAISLAQRFQSQLILIRVADTHGPPLAASHIGGAPTWLAEAHKQAREEASQYLEGRQNKLRQQGVDVCMVVYDTSPAEGIIDAATTFDADLIVMSTHGRGGLARWTYGSVADKVARHAPCPVLLVRQSGDDQERA